MNLPRCSGQKLNTVVTVFLQYEYEGYEGESKYNLYIFEIENTASARNTF